MTANTPGTVWSITRQAYRQALKAYEEQKQAERIRFLREVKLFQTLTSTEIDAIADNVLEENYADGEYIMRAGESVTEYR